MRAVGVRRSCECEALLPSGRRTKQIGLDLSHLRLEHEPCARLIAADDSAGLDEREVRLDPVGTDGEGQPAGERRDRDHTTRSVRQTSETGGERDQGRHDEHERAGEEVRHEPDAPVEVICSLARAGADVAADTEPDRRQETAAESHDRKRAEEAPTGSIVGPELRQRGHATIVGGPTSV